MWIPVRQSSATLGFGKGRAAIVLKRLRARKEWKFFAVLPRANRPLAAVWWLIVVLRGVLPAVFAIAMGLLVAAVEHGNSLAAALTLCRTVGDRIGEVRALDYLRCAHTSTAVAHGPAVIFGRP